MKILLVAILLSSSPLLAGQFAKTELERTFLKAAKEDNGELLKECLKNGVNPNVQDRITGDAALHWLLGHRGKKHERAPSYEFRYIPRERVQAIHCLLFHSHIDVNIKNTITGDTPLHIAARAPINSVENRDWILFILKKFEIPHNETFCSSVLALSWILTDFASIYVAALLTKGANPTLCNYFNKLPIHKVTGLRAFKFLLGKAENRVDPQMIIQSTKLKRAELEEKHLTFSPEYNGLICAIKAANFNSEIAKGALLKIKRKHRNETSNQEDLADLGCETDDWKLTSFRNSGRILRYYCILFDLLKSPEPQDPEKQCFPILPREIVHHYLAVPATLAYSEKMQKEAAKEDLKNDE